MAEIAVTVLVTDIDEPPGAPGTPEQESATATSLTIRWTAPENSGPPIQGYDVEYREFGGRFIDAEHDGPVPTAQLTGLRPGSHGCGRGAYFSKMRPRIPKPPADEGGYRP